MPDIDDWLAPDVLPPKRGTVKPYFISTGHESRGAGRKKPLVGVAAESLAMKTTMLVIGDSRER